MNKEVTAYIENSPTEQKQIMEALRNLLHESVTGITEEMKWGRPVFKATKDFVYFKTAKSYVTLGFFNFNKLTDKQNRLEGTGKDMRHVKLKTMQDIDVPLFAEWFKAAVK